MFVTKDELKVGSFRRQAPIFNLKNGSKMTEKQGYFRELLRSVNVNGGFQAQNVRIWAKSRNLSLANGGDQRMVTEFFPRVDVGEVDFDGRNTDRRDGIAEGDAGMSVGGCVQDDDVKLTFGLLNPSDEFALAIGLAEVDCGVQGVGATADPSFDVGEGSLAINGGFAMAEEVEVRSV
jgi:hypothetical protein